MRHKALFYNVFIACGVRCFRHHCPDAERSVRGQDAIMGRPRGTAVGKIHLVVEAPSQPASSDTSKPDPRLVRLVRIVARRAARDFVQAEMDAWKRDHLPE
jgi:hypothetical protein